MRWIVYVSIILFPFFHIYGAQDTHALLPRSNKKVISLDNRAIDLIKNRSKYGNHKNRWASRFFWTLTASLCSITTTMVTTGSVLVNKYDSDDSRYSVGGFLIAGGMSLGSCTLVCLCAAAHSYKNNHYYENTNTLISIPQSDISPYLPWILNAISELKSNKNRQSDRLIVLKDQLSTFVRSHAQLPHCPPISTDQALDSAHHFHELQDNTATLTIDQKLFAQCLTYIINKRHDGIQAGSVAWNETDIDTVRLQLGDGSQIDGMVARIIFNHLYRDFKGDTYLGKYTSTCTTHDNKIASIYFTRSNTITASS